MRGYDANGGRAGARRAVRGMHQGSRRGVGTNALRVEYPRHERVVGVLFELGCAHDVAQESVVAVVVGLMEEEVDDVEQPDLPGPCAGRHHHVARLGPPSEPRGEKEEVVRGGGGVREGTRLWATSATLRGGFTVEARRRLRTCGSIALGGAFRLGLEGVGGRSASTAQSPRVELLGTTLA